MRLNRAAHNASGYGRAPVFVSGFMGDQKIRLHVSLALYVELASFFAGVFVLDQVVCFFADLNGAFDPFGFHATGRVDNVAPEVVCEFVSSNDASDYRSRVDADSHPDFVAVDPFSH